MTDWRDYALLARDLAQRLSDFFGAETEESRHNLRIDDTLNDDASKWARGLN